MVQIKVWLWLDIKSSFLLTLPSGLFILLKIEEVNLEFWSAESTVYIQNQFEV